MSSGRALGSRYQLVGRLGEGAMGEVWRAHDRTTGTYRAAKLLKGSFASDHTIVGRFVQERAILLTLDHPNIVKVHDLVVEGDDLAIVMDLVEGPALGALLRQRGTLSTRDAVAVVCAILDALAAAHARGCLHRDVKPDNVLLLSAGVDGLDGADVRLTDFSIARLAQESTVMSTGLLGTPGYMPPELFTEGRFSAASDLYATGILLYELLAGRTPFAGSGTAHTVGFRHVQMAPPPIPVPAELWQVITTMLAKDPSLRLSVTATAAALRELPAHVLEGPALPVQPVPDDWHSSMQTAVSGQPFRVQVLDADLDVGATNLHDGVRAAAPVVADVGPAQALTPVAPDADLEGATMLGTGRERQAPVAEPLAAPQVEPTAPEPAPAPITPTAPGGRADRSSRPATTWVVAAVAVLALVLGVVVTALVVGGDDPAPDPVGPTGAGGAPLVAEPLTAQTEDPPLVSGLVVSRSATWDPDTATATVTFGFDSGSAAVSGPFLVVLPRPEGQDCPLAGFDPAAEVTEALSRTVGGARCGWLVPGSATRGLEVTAEVPLDVTADDGLQAWLDEVGRTTEAALAGINSGTDLAAQRLTGLRLDVANARGLRRGELLEYSVHPVWLGGDDRTEPIFVADLADLSDGTSPVIRQVAGDASAFEVQALDGCRALDRSARFRFEAAQPGSCTIEVTMGEVETTADVVVRTGGS